MQSAGRGAAIAVRTDLFERGLNATPMTSDVHATGVF